ncbi:hypothetical protein HUU05_15550 [candidate division KSB1 bacterium]|nr:hypothetical protein [candidate division KSB1 bacterium]
MKTKFQLTLVALFALLLVACPKPNPKPNPVRACLDFQAIATFPQTFAGPTFTVTTTPPNSLIFTNPIDPSGAIMPITLEDRVEDLDGKPELNVGFSRDTGGYRPMFVEFPAANFPNGVKDVTVELQHFASATMLALDNSGGVINTVTQPAQKTRVVLSLPGPKIRKLQFNVVETLVYKICWTPMP